MIIFVWTELKICVYYRLRLQSSSCGRSLRFRCVCDLIWISRTRTLDFRWILAWKRKENSRKLFCFEGGPAGGVQNTPTGKFNFRSQKSVKRIELVNIDEYNWVNLVAKFLSLKTMFDFPLQYDTNTTFGRANTHPSPTPSYEGQSWWSADLHALLVSVMFGHDSWLTECWNRSQKNNICENGESSGHRRWRT
mgnify:CR=1 FL=1